MHTHSAAVAAAIRSRRERLGLSQQQLADRAGLSRVSIVRYEAARSTPRLDSARAIARVLGTPVDDLLPHEEGLPMSRHPMTMPGAKRLMPGAYSVGDALHIVASELLAAGGFADTAENQAMVDEVMQRLGREIGAPVVYADEDEEGEP